jgi:hypothetical protein
MTYWDTNSLHDHKHLEELTAAQGSVAKTLASVAKYDGRWQTSLDRLAKDAGVNKRTASAAVKRLEELGIVSRDVAGRRSATVYTWHSCPSDCVISAHTGKKDKRASRHLFGQLPVATEAPAERKPKSKTARRREARERVSASLSGVVTPSSGALSHNVSGALSGSSGVPSALLKDVSQSQNRLKTKKSTLSPYASGAVSPWLNTEEALLASEILHRQAEDFTSANDHGVYADVLWQLLDDENHHHHVTALAAEWLTVEPLFGEHARKHFDNSESLKDFVIHYASVADIDISPLLQVINEYRLWAGGTFPWPDLSRLTRDALVSGWLDLEKFTDNALKVSEVTPTLTETVSPVVYRSSFPPHSVQVEDLTARLSAISRD